MLTCTRPEPPGPSVTSSRPAPLPGLTLMLASIGCTSPLSPVQSPNQVASVTAAAAVVLVSEAVPSPSENGTRYTSDGWPTLPSSPYADAKPLGTTDECVNAG